MSTPPNPFLSAADALGAQLARDAIWHGPRCNWTGDSMELLNGRWQVAHKSMGAELYSGLAGIALFLGRLHCATHERVYAKLARSALEQAHSQTQAQAFPANAQCGLYFGTLGVAWALVRVAQLIDAPELAAKGWALLQDLPAQDFAQHGVDITSGSAGAIIGLLDLERLAPIDGADAAMLLGLARRHGERLAAKAIRSERGWHWPQDPSQGHQFGLCGLSHGAAGIGWALLGLHKATGEQGYLTAAFEALRYERSWFNADEQNWPDLRSLYDPTLGGDGRRLTYMSAWCHGAPGIGMARLASHALNQDPACLTEARAALRCTSVGLELSLQMPPGQANFSLCHGLFGNAELLIEAAQRLGEPEHLNLAARIGHMGLAQHAHPGTPWACGVLGGGETPSLLLGLAGIGYFYLRLHDPSTPSVLLLGDEGSRVEA